MRLPYPIRLRSILAAMGPVLIGSAERSHGKISIAVRIETPLGLRGSFGWLFAVWSSSCS